MKGKWLRVRFQSSESRPCRAPPPGPYWCWGFGSYTIIAYVSKLSQVEAYWPEADHIQVLNEGVDIEYSDDFPKPEWWDGPRKNRKKPKKK